MLSNLALVELELELELQITEVFCKAGTIKLMCNIKLEISSENSRLFSNMLHWENTYYAWWWKQFNSILIF
jgi:hypothetical protein